jgi:hypothetical protein
MALQSSGVISLNDLHVEAGGSSGTACTINDSDIRGLISKGSGVSMNFAEWYGASAVVAPPSGVHKITFTVNLNSYVYAGTTYYYWTTTFSIIGGYNPSSAPYYPILRQLNFGGTLRSDHSGIDNVTHIEMRTTGSNTNNPSYTLFDEINTYDSRMKITDNNNNQLFEARFGMYLSPTPSFPTNPSSGLRRPTASFFFDLGECGESNEYRWFYLQYPTYYNFFDITFGQPYKIFFQP